MSRRSMSRLGLAMVIALPACAGPLAGGSGSLPAAQQQSAERLGASSLSVVAAKSKRSVYLVNPKGNSVDIYPAGVKNPKMSGQITSGVSSPVDVFIDKSGTVYVLNQNPASVTEYPAGQQAPSVTLNLGTTWTSYAMTVGPNGTIYLASYKNTNYYCSPIYSVLEFDKGAQSQSRMIHIPIEFPYCLQTGGLAVDWAGDGKFEDLYIDVGSGNSGGGFEASEYKLRALKPDGNAYSNGGYALGALQTDTKGELIAGDVNDGNVEVFGLGPAGGYRSFPIAGGLGWYESLDDSDGSLYLTNINAGTVSVYDFQSGALRYQFANGAYPYGVAVDPPSL